MSTLTNRAIGEKVIARLVSAGEDALGTYEPDIETWISEALNRVAHQVAYGPNPEQLQKQFAVSVTAGVGEYQTAHPTLMVDTVAETGQTYVGATPAKWVPRRQSLGGLGTIHNDVFHYAVSGQNFYVRNTDGSQTTLTGTLTIQANYVPTVTELPVRFERALIDTLIMMFYEKKGTTPPPLATAFEPPKTTPVEV